MVNNYNNLNFDLLFKHDNDAQSNHCKLNIDKYGWHCIVVYLDHFKGALT